METICGIYKITNLINAKIYIGQSINIYSRWKEHYRASKNENKTNYLYKAIRYYGIDNFKFEIVCECDVDELNDKEKYYIQKFNSNNKKYGYNLTEGGDAPPICKGEQNGNSKLTVEKVVDIRTRYNNHESKSDVFEDYKNCVTINTFNDVWQGKSWKNIMPEVYTEENKNFHRNNYDKMSTKVATRTITDKEILEIRDLHNQGELSKKEVYLLYSHINFNTFSDVWSGKTFKHIQSNIEDKHIPFSRASRNQNGENNFNAKLTQNQVNNIRCRKEEGENPMSVYAEYASLISKSTFYRIWNGQGYLL